MTSMNRREMLATVATVAGVAAASSASAEQQRRSASGAKKISTTRFVDANDATRLFVRSWGAGAPIVLVHSWALNSDMWQYQTVELAARGYRCIAYDRRGHGRSDEPAQGYDFDTLADDLASVVDACELTGITLVAHSMGAGEVVRYLTRHGAKRVSRVVLLAPTTPCMLRREDNPDGVPAQAFEALRAQWRADFPKWVVDNTPPFFTKDTSAAMMQWGTSLMLRASLPVAIECNRAMVEADFRADLRAMTVPTRVLHGDADVSAPLALTGARTAALIPGCRLDVYAGAPHGLFLTHMSRVNADILDFIARA